MSKNTKYACGVCGKCASTAAIFCNNCKKWNHLKCVNLKYNVVKNFSEDEGKSWKCLKCKQIDRETVLQTKGYIENMGKNINLNGSLNLDTEIKQALLQENEELRQALHETSNAKSMYELELEDKIQEREEQVEMMLKEYLEKENNLNLIIKNLKNKLEEEKKLTLELIRQAEVDKIKSNEMLKELVCKKCEIYKEEVKNMISTIRSLEAVIGELNEENSVLQNKVKNSELQCTQCFPHLGLKNNSSQNIHTDRDNWHQVPVSKKSDLQKKQTSESYFDTQNRFELFSADWSDEEDKSGHDTILVEKLKEREYRELNKNKSLIRQTKRVRKAKDCTKKYDIDDNRKKKKIIKHRQFQLILIF